MSIENLFQLFLSLKKIIFALSLYLLYSARELNFSNETGGQWVYPPDNIKFILCPRAVYLPDNQSFQMALAVGALSKLKSALD